MYINLHEEILYSLFIIAHLFCNKIILIKYHINLDYTQCYTCWDTVVKRV